MSVIGKMLTRMVLIRFFAILIGVAFFVLTLEVATYSNEILALAPGRPQIMIKYILMRAPATLVTFFPMSFLLAMLLTLTELSYRNELTAIWASGVSPLRLIAMLAPMAIGLGVLDYVLGDRAVPAVAPQLRAWAIADYGEKQLKLGEKDPIWLRGGNDILRVGRANADSTELQNIIIFERNGEGLLEAQTIARSGSLVAGNWELRDVKRINASTGQSEQFDAYQYKALVRPAVASARSGDPEEMTIGELGYFVSNSGFGIRPAYVYQTWWYKRIALGFTCLVILCVCVPLAARFRRGGGLGYLFAFGIGFGFVYFIFEGMMASAGELGFVSPWLAAWLPVMASGLLGIGMVLRSERN
jgi:lipopolysaccharide export system permease protein